MLLQRVAAKAKFTTSASTSNPRESLSETGPALRPPVVKDDLTGASIDTDKTSVHNPSCPGRLNCFEGTGCQYKTTATTIPWESLSDTDLAP